jgi:purine nucleoside permease
MKLEGSWDITVLSKGHEPMVRTALERYALLIVALAAFVTHPSVTRADTWVVNFPLPSILPFPQGYYHLRYNSMKQVLGIETGEGPTHMAASITALANDRRLDFSHAYWILAGIAGIEPNGPAGSAAWASYVIDGDLAYEIDAREIPSGWSTGYVPLGRSSPYQHRCRPWTRLMA